MKLGFIGGGNMATAIINGIINAGTVNKSNVFVSDISIERLDYFKSLGICTSDKNEDVVKECDIIILAVKPHFFEQVLTEIRGYGDKLYVSIAAGITIDFIRSFFDNNNVKVIRTMPNTPAMVGEGMTILCFPDFSNIPEDKSDYVVKIFQSIGKVQVLPEKLINGVTALSGSSPAYVYIMIEAMADAAVGAGISRDIAYTIAAQSVMGSAKMVLETKMHPGQLKDMVCSPGGCTIEAVHQLENDGFRSAIINCMNACTRKINKL